MTISYLVTVHNESKELSVLLKKLYGAIAGTNDEIVILDDFSTEEDTRKQLEFHKLFSTSGKLGKVVQHKLDGNFGAHKQYGNEQCSGDWIFQLDADEYPSGVLMEHLRTILDSNPSVELIHIPRVNLVRGLTKEDAQKWGWNVSKLVEFGDVPIVNWNSGDYQGRLYRNLSHVKWHGKVHEVIVGAKVSSVLPLDPDLALVHDKHIDRQRAQNAFYETIQR